MFSFNPIGKVLHGKLTFPLIYDNIIISLNPRIGNVFHSRIDLEQMVLNSEFQSYNGKAFTGINMEIGFYVGSFEFQSRIGTVLLTIEGRIKSVISTFQSHNR